MAAPANTIWSADVLDETNGFRVGIAPEIQTTHNEATVTVQLWVWTKYWIQDTPELKFDFDSTTAATNIPCEKFKTEGSSGAWKTSRQVLLATQSKTYSRTSAAQTVSLAASLGDIQAVAGTAVLQTAVTVPALTYYTIAYEANGGTGAPETHGYYYGTDTAISTVKPTRAGYDFAGWALTADAAEARYQPGQVWWGTNAANHTLYAVWKPAVYTVTFDANGGTGAPAPVKKTSGVAITLPTTSPTRAGYKFSGWATSAVATAAEYGAGSTFKVDADTVLYAVWARLTYIVTFNSNGGFLSPAAVTKTHDVTLTLPTTTPTRSGYRFLGWSLRSDATVAEYAAGGPFDLNADTRLYAVWGTETYVVTFDANGGTGAPTAVNSNYGSEVTIPQQVPVFTGRNFSGWSTSRTGAVEYTPGSTLKVVGDVRLYAVWVLKTYTVTFDANGGTGAPGSMAAKHGTTVTIPSAKPTKEGHSFLGWAETASATEAKYAAGGTATVTANLALYAVWAAHTYSVTFNANGGEGGPTKEIKTYGVPLTLPIYAPVRSGYDFKGWALTADAKKEQYAAGGIYTANQAADMYAVWRPSGTVLIKHQGVHRRGRIWRNVLGTWVTGIPWIKQNGVWLRGDGSAYSELQVVVEENAAGGLTYAITATNYTAAENLSGGLTYTIGGGK